MYLVYLAHTLKRLLLTLWKTVLLLQEYPSRAFVLVQKHLHSTFDTTFSFNLMETGSDFSIEFLSEGLKR